MPVKEITRSSRTSRKSCNRSRRALRLDMIFPTAAPDEDILPSASAHASHRSAPQVLTPSHIAAQMEAAALEVVAEQPGISAYDAARQAVDIVECEATTADNLMDLGHWQRGKTIEQFWNWALGKRNDLEDHIEALSLYRKSIAPVARMASRRGINSAVVREYAIACVGLLDAQDELDLFNACRRHIEDGEDDSLLDASDPAVLLLWERFSRIYDIAF